MGCNPEKDESFEYDVFLSHASEDTAWCEQLAEWLRNEGVRVWFDKWEIKPGDHLLKRLNDGLKTSRKTVAVWSKDYFRDDKTWTLAEGFAQQQPDVLAVERPLIPLLRDDCAIPPLFRNVVYLDFRNPDDVDLQFRKLIEALDLPKREAEPEDRSDFKEHELDVRERGRAAYREGNRFEDEVSTLYRLLGFEVKLDVEVSGVQMDVAAEKREGGAWQRLIIECKNKQINASERDKILARQVLIQRRLPKHRVVAVSSVGYAAETRAALDDAGVDCTTYAELLRELVPLDTYADHLIAEIEGWVNDKQNWAGRDLFIRPDLETDITYERRAALAHFAKWLADPRANLLVVLGDLGTGKTTLARFLAYQLARSFRDDPLRHPAPVLIPLREICKEVVLDSIVVKHFRDRGLPGVSFPRFEHLLRQGKVVLFFDAFDEMADRVRWDVTQQNFQELRRAAEGAAKVLLTCRTHYFKDRTEQVRLIGQGPSLTATETALYRELRQQSNAEVVYLQEFNDDQIRDYLRKTRGAKASGDWGKIQRIYNLRDLASRPLLLDMIVKSLPHLDEGQPVNVASLYSVYTNLWAQRDYRNGRVVLSPDTKLALMTELAWRMWRDEKTTFSTVDLVSFIATLHSDKAIDFGDHEVDDIVGEVRAASFLRRSRQGDEWHFMHLSFAEFFLACKVADAVKAGKAGVLATRRLDQKVVYFLALLDDHRLTIAPLQQILASAYQAQVSENAIQVLYWSARVRAGMEEKIESIDRLREELTLHIPPGVQLAGAKLQEVVLEGARLQQADLSGADLTGANLNQTHLVQCRLEQARLNGARLGQTVIQHAEARGVILTQVVGSAMHVQGGDFTDAVYDPAQFATAEVVDVLGMRSAAKVRRGDIEPVVQLGSPSTVSPVAWSRELDLLAAGGGDGIVRLYRATDGRLVRTLEGHKDRVWSVSFDPSGRTLASGSWDKTVKVWEASTGKLVRTLEGHKDSVWSVSFDPSGRTLASGSLDRTVKVWEASTGKLVRTLKGHKASALSVSFDPSGRTLASGGSGKTVKVWEASTGKLVRTLEGHQAVVWSVSFDPSGRTLASGSDDKTVKVWEASTGKLVRTLEGHQDSVWSVSFDPSGHTLASGSDDKTVKVWEASTGKLVRTLEGHQDRVWSVSFDPSGRTLASGSWDNTVKVWEASTGKLVRTLEGHQDSVWSVSFGPSGRTLASGSDDNTVKVWEAGSGKLVRTLEGHQGSVWSVSFDPSGHTLASGSDDKTVKVWEAGSGKLVRTLEGHRDKVLSVSFDPSGRTLASGSDDKTVKVWEAGSGKLVRMLEGHQDSVLSVSFDPSGHTLASGSNDKTVKVWEAGSGKLLRTLKGHRAGVRSVSFDPSGHTLASGSWDKTVKVWEASTGKVVHTLEGHKARVLSVSFDPSGRTLASSSRDNTVKVWEASSGRLLAAIEGHLGPVYSVCFASNGRYLVAAGTAGRLQLWDVEKAETFLYLYSFGPGVWLALLPDGRFDGTPDALRYLCYTERNGLNSWTAEELIKEFYDPKAVQEVLAKYTT